MTKLPEPHFARATQFIREYEAARFGPVRVKPDRRLHAMLDEMETLELKLPSVSASNASTRSKATPHPNPLPQGERGPEEEDRTPAAIVRNRPDAASLLPLPWRERAGVRGIVNRKAATDHESVKRIAGGHTMMHTAEITQFTEAQMNQLAKLEANLASVIRGKAASIRLLLVSLLAGGHALLEDVPGTGKTTLAKSLARSIDGTFRRVQFTPDLLPADITGSSFYARRMAASSSAKGPCLPTCCWPTKSTAPARARSRRCSK